MGRRMVTKRARWALSPRSNGVMTRAPMVSRSSNNTLLFHLCSATLHFALLDSAALCSASEPREVRPQCRYVGLPNLPDHSSRPIMPNAVNDGNRSFSKFLTFQDAWKQRSGQKQRKVPLQLTWLSSVQSKRSWGASHFRAKLSLTQVLDRRVGETKVRQRRKKHKVKQKQIHRSTMVVFVKPRQHKAEPKKNFCTGQRKDPKISCFFRQWERASEIELFLHWIAAFCQCVSDPHLSARLYLRLPLS